MADEPPPPDATWQDLCLLISSPDGVDYSTAANQQPGISTQLRVDLDKFRTVIRSVHWFSALVKRASKDFHKPLFTVIANDARQVLVQSPLDPGRMPFQPLEGKMTRAEIDAIMSADSALECTVHWGPGHGPLANLLSPATMTALAWLGDHFAAPVLDLAYAFAENYRSFTVAWLKCPFSTSRLDFVAVQTRAAALRTSASVNSPGDAIIALARQAIPVLENVTHAMFHAFLSRDYQKATLMDGVIMVHISEIVTSPAPQYLDCTSPQPTQVQSPLPTSSSLPAVACNFTDEKSSSWFRAAQYTFEAVKMPTSVALRGDSLSELLWHKFQSDVLHARSNCMHLSEKQVIQHLTSKFSRSDQHFSIAQECALSAHCTTRQWLEVIRDFYFTSGQFRFNLERGWHNYKASDATDFNDLIHHIKTYYRLVFLDYTHMQGKLSKLDFAWVLFTKLQHLMQADCRSPISPVIHMFMPLSTLLEQMNGILKPAMTECTDVANQSADRFTSWVVTQLQQVRESANTAKRYTMDTADQHIDYARLSRPTPSAPPARPARQHKPTPQAAAAAAAIPGPPHRSDGMQPQRTPSGPSGAPSQAPRQQNIPNLKEHLGDISDHDLRTFITRCISAGLFEPALTTALQLELKGGPTSVHGMLEASENLPHFVHPTFRWVTQTLLKMYFLFPFKQCCLCPVNREQPEAAQHPAHQCPTVKRCAPQEAQDRFYAEQFNRQRGISIMPAGHKPRRPLQKRERYDPKRKASHTHPKRACPNEHHIR